MFPAKNSEGKKIGEYVSISEKFRETTIKIHKALNWIAQFSLNFNF